VLCAVCCVLLFVVFQEPERKASKGKMIWGETKKNPPPPCKRQPSVFFIQTFPLDVMFTNVIVYQSRLLVLNLSLGKERF